MSDSNSFWGACKSCATIHSPAPPMTHFNQADPTPHIQTRTQRAITAVNGPFRQCGLPARSLLVGRGRPLPMMCPPAPTVQGRTPRWDNCGSGLLEAGEPRALLSAAPDGKGSTHQQRRRSYDLLRLRRPGSLWWGGRRRSSFVVRRRVMVGRLFEVGEPRALLSTAPDGKGSTD